MKKFQVIVCPKCKGQIAGCRSEYAYDGNWIDIIATRVEQGYKISWTDNISLEGCSCRR